MIERIFVDMDGVLADFESKYKEIFNKNPSEDYPEPKINNSYKQFFDQFVVEQRFAQLDPMQDLQIGLDYLEYIKETHKNIEIYILTSTAREKYYEILSNNKMYWLNKYNINYLPIFVPGKRFKKLYSAPHNVLIDDTKKNIDDWVDAGGIAIYHSSWLQTIFELKEFI